MELWLRFWNCAEALRVAFSRSQTFIWFVVALAGMCIRTDHAGVTSIVRALNLDPLYYRSLLHLFRSNAWNVERLTRVWVKWVMRVFGQYKVNGRYVLVADVKDGSQIFGGGCVLLLRTNDSGAAQKGRRFGVQSEIKCCRIHATSSHYRRTRKTEKIWREDQADGFVC